MEFEILYGRFEMYPEELKDRIAKEFTDRLMKLTHLESSQVESLLGTGFKTLKAEGLVGTRFGKRIKPSLQDLLDFVEKNKMEIPGSTDMEHEQFQKIVRATRDKVIAETFNGGKVQ